MSALINKYTFLEQLKSDQKSIIIDLINKHSYGVDSFLMQKEYLDLDKDLVLLKDLLIRGLKNALHTMDHLPRISSNKRSFLHLAEVAKDIEWSIDLINSGKYDVNFSNGRICHNL